MKSCPTCKRTFPDQDLTYCVDDGTPLTNEEWPANAYDPPGTYVPLQQKERRVWPWVVGVVGAFILGVVALMIAAAIFVPRMVRQRQGDLPVATTTENTDETDQAENINTPPPVDQEQVLAQLTDLEQEWTVANLNADKKKLARILADDYVGPDGRGRLQGKSEYINAIERDTGTEKWEFNDLKVQLAGDRATLTGKITFVTRGQTEEFDFIDKFVWRNGRWQATGSEVRSRKQAQEQDVTNH